VLLNFCGPEMILEHKTIPLFDKLFLEKAKAVPPIRLPNFMHDEACFLYVIEGKCTAVSEIEYLEAQPPDALLMKCGNFFNFCVPDENAPHYHAVAIHFHKDVLKKVYENELPGFLKSGSTGESNFARVETTEVINKYIESILFYFEHPQLVNEELLVLKLKELLVLLSQTERGAKVREILSNLFSPTTYQLKQVIEAHLYHDVSVGELAALCHMSESSFKREFKKEYNDSPASYLRNKKLERAKKLLEVGAMSVAEAAFECGFNDLAHFSKAFKEKFDTPPSRIKRP